MILENFLTALVINHKEFKVLKASVEAYKILCTLDNKTCKSSKFSKEHISGGPL